MVGGDESNFRPPVSDQHKKVPLDCPDGGRNMTVDPDAIALRSAELRRQAEAHKLRSLSLDELRQQPNYCGFVTAHVGPACRFVMLLINGDDGVALRWLWNRCYEPMSMALWTALAGRGEFCIDVGAHTGSYTLASRIAAPQTTTLAFEPHLMNYARLLANLRANEMSAGNAFALALSSKEGNTPFSVASEAWYHSAGGMIGHRDGAANMYVPATTLDAVAGQLPGRIGAIKIDVEGHEGAILRGATAILGGQGPDLILESSDAEAADECTRTLRNLGYSFYLIDDARMALERVDDLSPVLDGGALNMDRRNRLVTRRPAMEIAALSQAVTAAWWSLQADISA